MTKEQARWFRAASTAHRYAAEYEFYLEGDDTDADELIKTAEGLLTGDDIWHGYRDNGFLAVQLGCEKAGLA